VEGEAVVRPARAGRRVSAAFGEQAGYFAGVGEPGERMVKKAPAAGNEGRQDMGNRILPLPIRVNVKIILHLED
jgi:hypothetical protein